jgi:tRNA-binding EMAP/Myf-like protein
VGDITLQAKPLRGIESNGMILSIAEISGCDEKLLPENEQGNIVVLEDKVSLDASIGELLALD